MEEETLLRDKNPIAPPRWLLTSAYLGAGFVALTIAMGVLSNIFAPKATVFDLPESTSEESETDSPPIYKSKSEQQREAALSVLRTECNQLLDEELAIANDSLMQMRARRWEIYAQQEAPNQNLSAYQFLVQHYQGTAEEIRKLSGYGAFEPLPKDSKKLRELFGTLQEIKLAMTSRPDAVYPNVNMVNLVAQINDCASAAMLYNNALEFGAAEARNYQGVETP